MEEISIIIKRNQKKKSTIYGLFVIIVVILLCHNISNSYAMEEVELVQDGECCVDIGDFVEEQNKQQVDQWNATFQSTARETSLEMKSWRYYPTEEEVDYFCRIVIGETGNRSREGALAVMEVILGRMENENFPNTPIGVCEQPRQFSAMKNGVAYIGSRPVKAEDITEVVKEAVLEACKGSDLTQSLLQAQAVKQGITDPRYWKGGALYFHNLNEITNPALRGERKNIISKVEVAGQVFYRYWNK